MVSVAAVTTTVFLTLIVGIVMGFGLMFYTQARLHAKAIYLQGTLEHHQAESSDKQWTMIFIPTSVGWPKESWVFLDGHIGTEGPCLVTIEPCGKIRMEVV